MKKRITFFVLIYFLTLVSISIIQGQVDTLWTRTFGGVRVEAGNSVQQTSDGGYIIAGIKEIFDYGDGDVWLIKTNTLGDTLWTKTFGGSNYDVGYSVRETTDEGYIIVGTTESFGAGDEDVWLIKTNFIGDTLWTKTFGGIYRDAGRSVQQTTDGGYILIGYTDLLGFSERKIWLIKTNANGDTIWTKTYGFGNDAQGSSVQQTTDEGYIIVGYYFSLYAGYDNVCLIKTNISGDILWTKTFGGDNFDYGYSIQQTTDRGYIITGMKDGDVWLIKTTPEGTIIEQNDDLIILDFSLQQNYPNPFNPATQIIYTLAHSNTVSLIIYDLLGREVQTLINKYQTVGSYSVNVDGSSLSSGIYLYQLKVGNDFVATKKMILAR